VCSQGTSNLRRKLEGFLFGRHRFNRSAWSTRSSSGEDGAPA
jgi:hypothetical protein